MKKIAMFMAASVLAVSCAGEKAEEVTTGEAQEVIEVAEAKTFNLIDSSTVVWRGFKTFVDWSHEGTIAVDGKFLIANDKVAGGFIEIDFSEITVAEFADGTKEEYLLGHIRSEDFFFTDSFPTGSFEIVNVKELAGEGTNSLVVGNLTLRGITNSIEFPANINLDNDGVSVVIGCNPAGVVNVGRFPFAASGKARAAGETEGFVKLVFGSRYGELLGGVVVGAEATELVGELALGLRLEATYEELLHTIHAHPTMAEGIMEAAGEAFGEAINI